MLAPQALRLLGHHPLGNLATHLDGRCRGQGGCLVTVLVVTATTQGVVERQAGGGARSRGGKEGR
jgi:hypothetical protein